jgi:hypothetical protein
MLGVPWFLIPVPNYPIDSKFELATIIDISSDNEENDFHTGPSPHTGNKSMKVLREFTFYFDGM